MKNIVLTGMMGSGKTTCGRRLAAILGREFVDADAWIVEKAGMSIPEIFASRGEPAFRDLETQAARELGRRQGLVIATGGGMVLRQENVEALKANGVILFLDRPAGEIYDSTAMDGRPLAQGGRQAFLETFARRESRYRESADRTIRNFSSVEATLDEMLAALRQMEDVL